MKSFTAFLGVLFPIAVLITAVTTECVEGDTDIPATLNVTIPWDTDSGFTGKYIVTKRGRAVAAFYGIPYAEPPIKDLRFANPKPAPPNFGFYPAVQKREACPQAASMGHAESTNEDCLYLNVFKPLETAQNRNYPVMVFLNDGGMSGEHVAPEYLLDHDVVVVTGSYRVGPFGYLSIGTDACPGNFGLKDQRLLLQWVQQHIELFSGQPNQVTVVGGASITFQMVSPGFEGLFHKAILNSATLFSPWAFDYKHNRLRLALVLAASLGCNVRDRTADMDIVLCLRQRSVEEIVNATERIRTDHDLGINVFAPTIEPEHPEAFLTRSPTEIAQVGPIAKKVPIIIGVNAQEGIIGSLELYANEYKMVEYSRHLNGFIAGISNESVYSLTEPTHVPWIVDRAGAHYFGHTGLTRDNIQNITDFISDSWFFGPVEHLIINRLKSNPTHYSKTYFYVYNHRSSLSVADSMAAEYDPCHQIDLGVCHGDNMLALFPDSSSVASERVPTEEDRFVRETMTEMLVAFASTKDSDPNFSDTNNYKWSQTSLRPLKYLRVGYNGQPKTTLFGIEKGFHEERMHLWQLARGYNVGPPRDPSANSPADPANVTSIIN